MRVLFRGKFFYFHSGPEFVTEIQAEEWVGFWKQIDLTKRTEMINTQAVTALEIYPELFEVHLHMEGRKVPRMFKMANETGYLQVVEILQSGLTF